MTQRQSSTPLAALPITEVRRLARVKMSVPLLAQLFTRGEEILRARVEHGLPKGARLVHVEHINPFIVAFTFEHPEFESVAAGDPIPLIDVHYSATWPEEENHG